VLVLLLDLAPAAGPSPAEQEAVLLSELGSYMPELLERPRLVIGSKADVATEEYDGVRISAATRTGLDETLGRIAELVEAARTLPDAPEPVVVLRPQEDGISIEREDNGVWRVHGRIAERAVAVSDLRDPDALVFVQQRLQKIGVDRALARAGAREGDVVRIGNTELEYEEG
jgi:GTP-binding protein